ncbi:MAG: hypothetical protein ABSH01_05140 [Terriglobia bacterium]
MSKRCWHGGQTPEAPATPTVPNFPDVKPQILQLVIQDQWDRGNDMFSGKRVKVPANLNVEERDEQRHAEVRKILAEGKINSGREYFFAALIFQHSSAPVDLMFAHMLAVTAVAKGNAGAKWMAAATLDRYLWSIKQSQIFGTQFHKGTDQKWTMEPYDRTTVSYSIRATWCVVPLEDQEKVLKDVQDGAGPPSTGIRDCK